MNAYSEIHERELAYRANPVRRFLWWLGAGQADVLEDPSCTGERLFHDALGLTVALTAFADGVIGGMTTKAFLFHGSAVAGVAFGLCWGGAILILDRMLLAGMDAMHSAPRSGAGVVAAWRIFGAVVISTANALPAECLLFAPRLDVQVAENKTAEVAREQALLSGNFRDISDMTQRRDALRQEIAAAQDHADAAAQQMIAEDDGTGGSGLPGDGVRHREKAAEFQRLQGEAARLRSQDGQATADLERQIKARTAQRDVELAGVQSTIDRSDDLLSRVEALADLKSEPRHGSYVTAAGLIFSMLALLFGVGPVLAKLMRAPSAYDALVAARRESARARWNGASARAAAEAAAQVERERVHQASGVSLAGRLAEEAVEGALKSPEGHRQRRKLMRDVLDAAVPAARRVAQEAFEPRAMAKEIAAAAKAARRRQHPRVVEAERRRAETFEALARAERVAESLRAEATTTTDNEVH